MYVFESSLKHTTSLKLIRRDCCSFGSHKTRDIGLHSCTCRGYPT